jgi:hypothetical protein
VPQQEGSQVKVTFFFISFLGFELGGFVLARQAFYYLSLEFLKLLGNLSAIVIERLKYIKQFSLHMVLF